MSKTPYRRSQLQRARALRASMTDAEQRLWRSLRHQQLGAARFRRQHPVGQFVLDFACLSLRLALEVDGGQHAEQADQDAIRTRMLERDGWLVIRYWNNDVLQNLDGVLEDLLSRIAARRQTLRQSNEASI